MGEGKCRGSVPHRGRHLPQCPARPGVEEAGDALVEGTLRDESWAENPRKLINSYTVCLCRIKSKVLCE